MRQLRTPRPGRGLELLMALIAALGAGGAAGYMLALHTSAPAPTSEQPAAKAERVTALGRLQPSGTVVPVFGPPGDRISKMFKVNPGDLLKAGTPVAELASRKDRLLELQIAETQQEETNNSLKLARVAGNAKLEVARAELALANANNLDALEAKQKYLDLQSETAKAGVTRLEKLRVGGSPVADETMEKAKLLAAQAEAEAKAGAAVLKSSDITLKASKKAASDKIAAAEAELKEAEARVPTKSIEEKLTLARQLSDQTILKAPVGGTVLKVIGREGQPTGLEPILQMADLTAMTAIAEVYESDVERLSKWVKAGPVKAEIKNPALPKALSGTVNSEQDISRMIAKNQVFAMGPREDADRRVIEVVVHLNADAIADASRFVGLQVTVTLEPSK